MNNILNFLKFKVAENFKSAKSNDIIQLKAQTQVDKLESVPLSITGMSLDIEGWLAKNKIDNLREQIGKIVSIEGRAALALIPVEGRWPMIDAFSVRTFDEVYSEPRWVEVAGGVQVVSSGTPYPLITRYELNDAGFVEITRYSYQNGKRVMITKNGTQATSWTKLPIKIFKNTADMKSDIELAGVLWEMNQLDIISNHAEATFWKSLPLLNVNQNFTDNDPKRTIKKIESGEERFISEDSVEAKLGPGTVMLAGVGGYELTLAYIATLEDSAFKKLGIDRDTIQSGSNTLAIEVVTQNTKGFEQMSRMKIRREKEYQDFFDMVADILGVDKMKVALKLSILEELRVRTVEASIAQLEMAAQNKAAQAESGGEEE